MIGKQDMTVRAGEVWLIVLTVHIAIQGNKQQKNMQ